MLCNTKYEYVPDDLMQFQTVVAFLNQKRAKNWVVKMMMDKPVHFTESSLVCHGEVAPVHVTDDVSLVLFFF